jgi:hypothetical protein
MARILRRPPYPFGATSPTTWDRWELGGLRLWSHKRQLSHRPLTLPCLRTWAPPSPTRGEGKAVLVMAPQGVDLGLGQLTAAGLAYGF